jgi:hypothetical protein
MHTCALVFMPIECGQTSLLAVQGHRTFDGQGERTSIRLEREPMIYWAKQMGICRRYEPTQSTHGRSMVGRTS